MEHKQKKYLIGAFVALAVIIFVILLIFVLRSHRGKMASMETGGAQVEYYTCGMHPSVRVSPEEYKKGNINCPICNMKLIPVYKSKAKPEKGVEKRILFYRHPTDPSKTSMEPMNDKEGHPYVPVYEETGENANYYGCGMEGEEHVFYIKGIDGMRCPICGMPLKKLSKEKADKLRGVAGRIEIKNREARLAGIKIEPAKKRVLFKKIRTVGRVAYDPMLAVAEDEYISALKASQKIGAGGFSEIKSRARGLVESAAKKLKLLGLSDQQIDELKRTRKPHSSLVLPEKRMWVYGDVYEYEMGWLKPGQKVLISTEAVPGKIFEGVISSLVPVIDPKTRSARFRVEVDNPDLELKPDMYVDIETRSDFEIPDDKGKVLTIPKDAVLDTGTRKIVWLDKGGGRYEGREIVTGPLASSIINGKMVELYPVIKGLKEGDLVVTKANFLVDSQSQLTGAASTAYGGALGAPEGAEHGGEKMAPHVHQH